jgi:NAD(P)-dependent dehydrogenase (short-subunit alcohol dehydrogenase family)
VIVTGAGGGLGRAYALDAAAHGAAVVVNDVVADAAAEVAEAICDSGGRAVADSNSVASWAGAEAIVGACVDSFGRLDGLVNNAGVLAIEAPWEMTEDARMLVEVNILGSLYVGRHAMRVMLETGSGSIVNATSSAQLGIAGMAVYGATKGAIASMTYSWALDLKDRGIRVNAYSPVASTAMSDRGGVTGLPTPEDNAPVVTFLLGDLAKDVTGQVIQRRGDALVIVDHPRFTPHSASCPEWTPALVGELFGPVLREHSCAVGYTLPARKGGPHK